MDENKRRKLDLIGYKIAPACGFCEYGKFSPCNDFGDCAANSYVHEKHGRTHQLSINRFGLCPTYKEDPRKIVFIHAFKQFMES